MKFIKLHQGGTEFLVNLSKVSEVYMADGNKSWLYFSFMVDETQVSNLVDESIDEILELIKQVSA